MGLITSLPITTTKINELPIYGAIDLDKAKKDLFEVSKNEGTFSTPVYNVGGSRKVTGDELITSLGLSSIRESITVTVYDTISDGTQVTDVNIGTNNDNDYFRLEIINRTYSDYFFNSFRLLLPVTPRNGFSFICSFDSNGTNTNNFDSYTFSSGFTYLITWSTSDNKWFYDKQKNVQDSKPSYVFNYMNYLNPIPVYDAGQTYYLKWRQPVYYALALPLLRLNCNEEITFILIEDMDVQFNDTDTPLTFTGSYDPVLLTNDNVYPNTGLNYVAPPMCKKGSSWTFKAVNDNVIISSFTLATERLQGWYLTHSNIIL
jgi:hypothetical protein